MTSIICERVLFSNARHSHRPVEQEIQPSLKGSDEDSQDGSQII